MTARKEASMYDLNSLAEFNAGVERARTAYQHPHANFTHPELPELDFETAPVTRTHGRVRHRERTELQQAIREALGCYPDLHDGDIAALVGCAERTVLRFRTRHGIPPRPVIETPRVRRD